MSAFAPRESIVEACERLKKALARARSDPRLLSADNLSHLRQVRTRAAERIAVKDGVEVAVIPVELLEKLEASPDEPSPKLYRRLMQAAQSPGKFEQME